MRANYEQELELLEQLEEAKGNEAADPDPKAKGGKGKAAPIAPGGQASQNASSRVHLP